MTCKRGGSSDCSQKKRAKSEEEEEEEEGMARKRIMVLVDRTACAKNAMIWALTHVANKGDLLTLLLVQPPRFRSSSACREDEEASNLMDSLASICKAMRPQVRVEALTIKGPKLATVITQVKKLGVSVMVLKQSNPSPLCCMFKSRHEELVEQCISRAECLTMAVRKQSSAVGGYLVSTRWQKNFWLLA